MKKILVIATLFRLLLCNAQNVDQLISEYPDEDIRYYRSKS